MSSALITTIRHMQLVILNMLIVKVFCYMLLFTNVTNLYLVTMLRLHVKTQSFRLLTGHLLFNVFSVILLSY